MFKHIYSSVSKWEDSFFGGYDGVVYDHPYVTIPEEIKYYPPNDTSCKLNYHTRDKLIRIFLNKVAANNLVDDLLVDHKVKENEDKRVAVISKKTLKFIVSQLSVFETELSNLFYFYEDFICNTEIEIDLPKPKKSNPKKDKSDSSGSDDTQFKNENNGEENGENNDGDDLSDEQSSDTNTSDLLNNEEMKKVRNSVNKIMKKIFTGRPSNYVFSDDKGLTNKQLKEKTKFVHVDKATNPCRYSSNQIMEATRLLSILDINFQPKEDKVTNLKLGKVDVSKIAEIPCGNTHVYYKIEENVSTRPFSVCILADESGSMKGSDANSNSNVQNHILKILYKTFSSILPPDKIYVYGHSGVSSPIIRIYNDKYNHNFEYTIENQLKNDFNENYDGPVIENIYEKIRSQTSDNIIFISISDGEPWGQNYGGNVAKEELKRIIEKCKRDGFITVGVGFKYTKVKDVYQYHTVIDNVNKECAKQIGSVINQVVKSEFQC